MRSKAVSRLALRREASGWIFVLPMLIFFSLFVLYPIANSVKSSFYGFDFTSYYWAGLDNYKELMKDELFWKAVWNTTLFVIYLVPAITVLSLLLAVIINTHSRPMQTFFKAVFYIPGVASIVSLSLVWGYMLNPHFGLGNYVRKLLGLEPVNWLGVTLAYPTLSLILLTLLIGASIVVFTAALNGIPADLYESASLDGANAWDRFYRITLPMLKPTLLYVILTSTIGAFQVFAIVMLMTGGGPAYRTTTILLLIYNQAFLNMNFGMANAMGVMLCLLICAIALLQFKFLKSDVEY